MARSIAGSFGYVETIEHRIVKYGRAQDLPNIRHAMGSPLRVT
jgi:hypothetical protein